MLREGIELARNSLEARDRARPNKGRGRKVEAEKMLRLDLGEEKLFAPLAEICLELNEGVSPSEEESPRQSLASARTKDARDVLGSSFCFSPRTEEGRNGEGLGRSMERPSHVSLFVCRLPSASKRDRRVTRTAFAHSRKRNKASLV